MAALSTPAPVVVTARGTLVLRNPARPEAGWKILRRRSTRKLTNPEVRNGTSTHTDA
jgi:hypothetical protein